MKFLMKMRYLAFNKGYCEAEWLSGRLYIDKIS